VLHEHDVERLAPLWAPFHDEGLELEVDAGRSRLQPEGLRLAAEVLDRREGGAAVGFFDRLIGPADAWHKSSLTYDAFQRRGIARRVLSASVALYDSLGVGRVHLNAVGPGRYVWARCGFDFAEDARAAATDRARALAEELGYDLGEVAHAWELAERGERVARFDEPLGRVLLLRSGIGDWDGVLDLSASSPGRGVFERYCRPS